MNDSGPEANNAANDAERNGKRNAQWNWLLLLPVVGLLFPGLYARSTPALFGFPFFYWYQFAWVFITAAITALVYRLVKD